MIGYLIRRVLLALVVLLGVVTVTFLLLHLLPGDQGKIMLGPRATPAQWAEYDHLNGLDQPLPVQYVMFLGNIVHGRIAFTPPGYANTLSLEALPTFIDIGDLVTGPLPNSLLLIGIAYVLILTAGVPIGIFTAVRRRRASAHLLNAATLVVYATPAFFTGIVLTVIFTSDLHVLSANTPEWITGDVLGDPMGLILPVLTLALGHVALYGRYLRASILDNLSLDYVTAARSRGVSERDIIVRHVLRNSLLPIVTLLGTSLPAMFGLDAIVEYLFQYPGIGLALFQAAYGRDFYTMLGVVLIAGVIATLSSLIADIAYGVLDPRIRRAG